MGLCNKSENYANDEFQELKPWISQSSVETIYFIRSYLKQNSIAWLYTNEDYFFKTLESKIDLEKGYTEINFLNFSAFANDLHTETIHKLSRYHQLIFNIYINHPKELTPRLLNALSLLADCGIIINNVMTLIKNVNDNTDVIKQLNHELLKFRVRPNAILLFEVFEKIQPQASVTTEAALSLMDSLRGWTSGLAVPHLLSISENLYSRPLLPSYIQSQSEENFIFRNYEHKIFKYENSI